MARYMIFEKTKNFQYKFKGTAEAGSGNQAIKKMKARGHVIRSTSPYIAIPVSQFMKYQLNPTKTKGKRGIVVNWKKSR